MAFQIKKPEIKSIHKAVWKKLKTSQLFRLFLVALIVGMVLVTIDGLEKKQEPFSLIIITLVGFFVVIVSFPVFIVWGKTKSDFWKQFAEVNGWQYKDYSDSNQESGMMFRQGNNRHVSHIIDGNIDGRPFRIFNYDFAVGSGKIKKTHHYTVFSFKFNGSFPHIYLNNRHNPYNVSAGEKIPLPGEFEKNFSLSAPKEYEIEALEIFTPDVLTRLLDGGFTYDIEFVDQEMLVFTDGLINNSEELIQKFNKALELEDLFDEKLDKFKFQPIGDMSHYL